MTVIVSFVIPITFKMSRRRWMISAKIGGSHADSVSSHLFPSVLCSTCAYKAIDLRCRIRTDAHYCTWCMLLPPSLLPAIAIGPTSRCT